MTTVLLALTAAAAYGVSDFLGGYGGRRTSPWGIAVVAQVTGLVVVGALAQLVDGDAGWVDLVWGALAGVGAGIGTGFLYRGLGTGRMGVVAPVSAVGAALVPVATGVLGGERPAPLVWLGVLLALPGIWLVSTEPEVAGPGVRTESTRAALVDGLLAGLGFGTMFAGLGQVPGSAGLLPLTVAQGSAVVSIVTLATLLRVDWLPGRVARRWGVAAGLLAAGAVGGFLLAAQAGMLTVAGVLTSLYPAFTVLLATVVLKERVHRAQGIGLGLCGVAVAFVAAG